MNKDSRDSRLIFFGNKETSLFLSDIKESRFSFELQNLVQDFGLQKFIALDQVHGNLGVTVTKDFFSAFSVQFEDQGMKKNVSWFNHQGDFLITDQKNIGLVVLTADCVPLVLYDPVLHVVGLVHAGWKGSYLGVLQKAVQAMQQNYGTEIKNLQCSFGPSARLCCYEVSQQFVQDFEKKYFEEKLPFLNRNLKYYFDNCLFLQQLLKKIGIPSENIYTDNALCTICNAGFCSFRKEKESANRQVTMVALF